MICLSLLPGLYDSAWAKDFVHPGILHTQQDLDRMREKVAAKAQPWYQGWQMLDHSPYANLNWQPRPQEEIRRGGGSKGGENYILLARDIAVAYNCALHWHITGDKRYADKTVEILNGWGGTLKKVGGDSNGALAAGTYGYQFAVVAELMRDYPGFSGDPFKQFKTMMRDVFYPYNKDFLQRHNGTCDSHYRTNWDACNLASIIAIGVLCDDDQLVNEAVNYYKNGHGNGNVHHAFPILHPGDLAQLEESGRDQPHAGLGIGWLGAVCQIAWDQGIDLYGYDDNRLLKAAQYYAKYNLGYHVPYRAYNTCDPHVEAAISPDGRGRYMPFWERIYNHYVVLKKLDAPYVTCYAQRARPEGGAGHFGTNSGGFDMLGFGTLTCTLLPEVPPALPIPWQRADIGNVAVSGNSWIEDGSYFLKGSGKEIWGKLDSFHYLYQTRTGEVQITARVANWNNTSNAWARSGVMIRQSLDADSPHVTMAVTPGKGVTFTYRDQHGGDTHQKEAGNITAPCYVRLLRTGSTITGSYSQNGAEWTELASRTMAMDSSVLVGLPICSNDDGRVSMAQLDRVVINGKTITRPDTPGDFHASVRASNQVNLSWQSTRLAASYTVQRALVGSDEWIIVAQGVDEPHFTDTTVNGRTAYNYRVIAVNGSGNSLPSSIASITTPGEPIFKQTFDDQPGGVLTLNGKDDYALPQGCFSPLNDAWSIRMRVNLAKLQTWARIFDCGIGTSYYMMLTPKGGKNNAVRFVIAEFHHPWRHEEVIEGSEPLPVNQWVNVVVTQQGNLGRLYVDGKLVGQNEKMTNRPFKLGYTTHNSLGKSSFNNDPLFKGQIDDFAIFNRVLNADELQ
jgi:hypothetical protein